MTTLVVTALGFERAAFHHLAHRPGWRVASTGVGPARAADGLARLIRADRPALVVGAGVCGALEPALRLGDLVLPAEAVAPEGARESLALDERLCQLARRFAEAHGGSAQIGGRIVSVERIASTPTDKRELARRFEALAVDQETFAWARVAREAGIPFVAVRVVLDEAGEPLASWRPSTWRSALRLPARALRARRTLRAFGREWPCWRS
ncbi:purine or other phosphorylase family 1 [Alicyclobacillus acidocaldarius subsp. acidocaldarius DSM 446]|uniref:Purine or other phosphorylase family 1 n=1 Tax=Alicyclobacillus acidocaldarius subsp. acidocaldarius (strain ATCC 27009 / DSM 446 / BCRC 14685 / JCM 5260 / KCTC 1825 / NBRC 15652 / NCIMB 11725 / NRRL B-14509 / 104-IA) TaxID=521098 RepID=C8WSG6_ALIAD|nr:purine or other phosphorylase family 1 [Alicyclobacillus acidocaldarius subsp. acidocaldarius DSM 446]